jgi:hypothetical protein
MDGELMDQFNEETHKIQYALYGITGSFYKKGFAKNYKTLFSLRRKHSRNYGSTLSLTTVIVPKDQTWHSVIAVAGPQYCFCPSTPICVNKCPKCGKSPYTD